MAYVLKQAEIDKIEANTKQWLRREFKIDFTVNLTKYNNIAAGYDDKPKTPNKPAKTTHQRPPLLFPDSPQTSSSSRKTILLPDKLGRRHERKRKKSSDHHQRDADDGGAKGELPKKKKKKREEHSKEKKREKMHEKKVGSSEMKASTSSSSSSAPSLPLSPVKLKQPKLPDLVQSIVNIKKEPTDYVNLLSDEEEEEEQVSPVFLENAMKELAKGQYKDVVKMSDKWAKSSGSDLDESKSAKTNKTSFTDDTNKYKRFDIHITRPNQLFDKNQRESMKEDREDKRNELKKKQYQLNSAEANIINAVGNHRKERERTRNYVKDDYIKIQQQYRVLEKKLYGKSSCSALQFSAGRADDDTIFIARDVIDRVYPSRYERNKVTHEEHAQLIQNIEGRGLYAMDRAKTEAINANLEKRQKIHEYIDLWAPKAQAKKPPLKTPEDKKAEAAKKRLQHEQQRSLNALRPTPNKEPLRANSHRHVVTHTLPPTAVKPVTPLARPLSSQVNSQLDPRRRPSSSSSNPVSLPVHPSFLGPIKDRKKDNDRPSLKFESSDDENDLANILK